MRTARRPSSSSCAMRTRAIAVPVLFCPAELRALEKYKSKLAASIPRRCHTCHTLLMVMQISLLRPFPGPRPLNLPIVVPRGPSRKERTLELCTHFAKIQHNARAPYRTKPSRLPFSFKRRTQRYRLTPNAIQTQRISSVSATRVKRSTHEARRRPPP